MKVPETYMGPLRYHRAYRSSEEMLDELIVETLTKMVEEDGEAVSLHLVFEDYGEKIHRSLSYIDSDTLYRALDWYNEVQEGTLVKACIGKPNSKPFFGAAPEE